MTASFPYTQAMLSTPDVSSGISSGVEVRLQMQGIAIEAELAQVMRHPKTGAIVNFLGVVRQSGDIDDVMALEIEHYPGMTERTLWTIVEEAQARWPLDTVKIVHRIGRVPLGQAMVMVIVAAQQRSSAFSACEFLMDVLKHNAPFWKKEVRRDGATEWVVPHSSNEHATIRWG